MQAGVGFKLFRGFRIQKPGIGRKQLALSLVLAGLIQEARTLNTNLSPGP